MEEEHSTINNNSNDIVQMTSSSNARRLQIRRGILRQTTALRTSPYNSSLSNLRRRQTSLIASQTNSHLITNIENTDIPNSSSTDQEETEMMHNNFLITSDDENPNDHFEVLVDFSNTSPVDLTITNGEFISKFGFMSKSSSENLASFFIS
jgi:hypothetical protein